MSAAQLNDDLEYIENSSPFSCMICLNETPPGDGILLKSCAHEFCKPCITKVIQFSPEAEIRCPQVSQLDSQQCPGVIQDRELRCFISDDDYQRHIQKSLSKAELDSRQSFHCKTPNCHGWVEIVHLKSFRCEICKALNCVTCKAVHEGVRCWQYRSMTATDNERSNSLIRKLLREKKVMKCPKCGILVEKTRGCNHMRCIKCLAEFQWIGKSGFEWVR